MHAEYISPPLYIYCHENEAQRTETGDHKKNLPEDSERFETWC